MSNSYLVCVWDSRDQGEVWVVRWEATEIRACAPNLTIFFSCAIDLCAK